ncbi:hypothetical protein LCGC14_1563940 [marine sediment metagenome]|uniref:ParB-like N-terminal domain-containing protein n=1 Tax=marine sediment metagenome TaxID=412755 RepID=A0A0F9ILP3_9ZZZZ
MFKSKNAASLRLIDLDINELNYSIFPKKEWSELEYTSTLFNHIKEHGILEPLLVINNSTGLTVTIGNHRLWVAKKLGIDEVTCLVVTLKRDLERTDNHRVKLFMKGKLIIDPYSVFSTPIDWREYPSGSVRYYGTNFQHGDIDVWTKTSDYVGF